ncbi:hypothetical protein [Shewanella sp. NIFS-20-20]|nr:hypothetical protein [Shewanella sp. NIFS-20-20]MBV7316743.1 hypothetical protein [Shewanella sp. NIFS-20-20]
MQQRCVMVLLSASAKLGLSNQGDAITVAFVLMLVVSTIASFLLRYLSS